MSDSTIALPENIAAPAPTLVKSAKHKTPSMPSLTKALLHFVVTTEVLETVRLVGLATL